MSKEYNFLFYSGDSHIHWANEFKALYFQELLVLGYNVQVIESIEGKSGYLIIGHHSEYHRYKHEKYNPNVRIVMQSNGTSVNPFIFQVNEQEEYETLLTTHYTLTASDEHTKLLKDNFGVDNVYTVGMPVRNPNLKHSVKHKGQYVIAGRLTPDKCVYESIRIAMLQDGFKKVVVCYPPSQSQWVQYYPKRMFIEYRECDNNLLIQALSESEGLVIYSLGDVMSVVTVEAIYCGCKIIARDNSPFKIPFYEKNINTMSMFDPKKCAERLISIL